jgi:protein Tex
MLEEADFLIFVTKKTSRMNVPSYIKRIAAELNLSEHQVKSTLSLLENGATIPFISRYRKEMTGSLDEVQVSDIKIRYSKLLDIDKRRETILKSIEEQGKLTEELKQKIENAHTITELEDIYLPYKPKKRTRGMVARENGLEPLAHFIMKQHEFGILKKTREFINDKVPDEEEALKGARDIIAEWINEHLTARNRIRTLFSKEAKISAKIIKGKETEAIKYKDYYDYSELLNRCPSHRLLAIRRAETEGFLRINIEPSDTAALQILSNLFDKQINVEASEQLTIAIKDSYKRLLSPSIETEFANLSKETADEEAIRVFAENLKQLLLEAPLGQKRILAIDPGYKSGCKVVCLDENGTLIHNQNIYPHPPRSEAEMAMKQIKTLVNSFKIDAIAIGNGTASRETEFMIKRIRFDRDVKAFVVSEDGASVYSASDLAREEFPEFDVTVRGTVSIGRRLMDPLAELVKIDPKAIGVGQYQHDVDQAKLKNSLDEVTINCVNKVGVNINTASKHILTYISGLGPVLAQNIISYRSEKGPFLSRNEIKKVPRMGEKAYEQSAGFLRISAASNPLDNSAVHPESYHFVEKMAKDLKCGLTDLMKSEELRKKIDLNKYVTADVGIPTLTDIMNELAKPGRDPRNTIKFMEFDSSVRSIEDLKEGMKLPGIVTNITNFGAFVDIGVKQDGLIHISNLANEFVKNPADIVSLHQHVEVTVISLDIERKRIGLSMKN